MQAVSILVEDGAFFGLAAITIKKKRNGNGKYEHEHEQGRRHDFRFGVSSSLAEC